MKNNIMYFNVFKEEKIISTELVIYDNNNCYSYLGGTLDDYFDLQPNELLKYEIIKWAKNKNLKNYVLDGGYGSDDGIFKYKKCIVPNGIVDFYIGKKIFLQESYDSLVEIRKSEEEYKEENLFPPRYRA